MLFSQETQAFYDETLDYKDLPNDVIEISLTVWQEALQKINDGYYVTTDENKIEYSTITKPNRFYSFDKQSKSWVQSKEDKILEVEMKNNKNLAVAEVEYNKITNSINSYSEMLEDEDYSLNSKEELSDLKSKAINYRKELRAYLTTGNGSVPLPQLEKAGG